MIDQNATSVAVPRDAPGRHARAPREVLLDLLRQFIAYIKAKKLYPPGHQRMEHQLELLTSALDRVFEHQREFSIFIQPDAISISGEEFTTKDNIASDFPVELVRRLIRFIVIKQGVEVEELEALAEPILMDADELKRAGGARGILYERRAMNIFLIELSYKMGSYISNEEDLNLVRRLASYEQGATPEPYVLRRMEELGVEPDEHERLGRLMLEPEVAKRLAGLHEMFGTMPDDTEEEMHTCDLMLYLVRSLGEAGGQVGGIGDQDAAAVISSILDQFQERLVETMNESEEMPQHELFSEVARRTMSSPEDLIKWLSLEVEKLDLSLSPDQSNLLKAIFSRPEEGERTIRFGDSEMKTLKAEPPPPADPEEEPKPMRKRGQQAPPDVKEVFKLFEENVKRIQDRSYELHLEAVSMTHLDILLEMLRVEEKTDDRKRLMKEAGTFLGKQILDQLKQERILVRWFGHEDAQFSEEELTILFQSQAVCRQGLLELCLGEEQWHDPLIAVAQNHTTSFSAALGRLMIEDKTAASATVIREFVPLCQDKLVSWLMNELNDPERTPPVQRIATVMGECNTPRMVPLVERLMDMVDEASRVPLLRNLVRIDDARAMRLLTFKLEKSDPELRSAIIKLLGESKHHMAEQALLDVANQGKLFGLRAQERQLALSALIRCATRRSLDALRILSRKPLYVLTGNGRRIRALAGEAVAAVEHRKKTRRFGGEE